MSTRAFYRPYRILDVSPDAPMEDVTAAFRRLAKDSHPDLGGQPARFRELVEARRLIWLDRGWDNPSAGPALEESRWPAGDPKATRPGAQDDTTGAEAGPYAGAAGCASADGQPDLSDATAFPAYARLRWSASGAVCLGVVALVWHHWACWIGAHVGFLANLAAVPPAWVFAVPAAAAGAVLGPLAMRSAVTHFGAARVVGGLALAAVLPMLVYAAAVALIVIVVVAIGLLILALVV